MNRFRHRTFKTVWLSGLLVLLLVVIAAFTGTHPVLAQKPVTPNPEPASRSLLQLNRTVQTLTQEVNSLQSRVRALESQVRSLDSRIR